MTPDQIAEMTRRWLAGESFGVIGKALGFTRNKIAGRIHRIGLSRHPKRTMPTKRILPPKRLAKPQRAPLTPIAPVPGPGVPLEELRPFTCRWTDSEHEPWAFCGERGWPWCPFHASRVFAPSKVRAA